MNPLTHSWAKRIAVAIVGGTVLAVGIVMIVLPGPAFIVIPVGLGILGLEFAWARVWLKKIKSQSQKVIDSVKRSPRKDSSSDSQK